MQLPSGRTMVGPVLGVLALLVVAPRAQAHALGAECKLRGDQVDVEAYYDDDTPARLATVRVEAGDGQMVAQGKTNAEGRWSFGRPKPGSYVVVVDAGAGHRTQVKLEIPSTGTADDATVSIGPDRQAFTAYPWLKLAVGVVVIGGLGVAFLVARRLGQA